MKQNGKNERYIMSDSDVDLYTRRINPNIDLREHFDETVRLVAEAVPDLTGKRALDLGTGEGRWARYMAKARGADSVVGIDVNKRILETARARTPEPTIDYTLGELWDMDGDSFDFINAFMVTQYIQNLRPYLGQLSRVLKDGGEAIIATKVFSDRLDTEAMSAILTPNGRTVMAYPHTAHEYLEEGIASTGLTVTGSVAYKTSDVSKEVIGAVEDLIVIYKKQGSEDATLLG